MARIDEMPEYQAQLGRTGHSLSHDFAFTAPPALLLPVFHDFLNAGESVTLGFDFLLRTQPLEAAAMSKIKCHTEYFFVPMQLLYQGFSDWYYGIREEFSSRFIVNNELGEFTLPKVDLATMMTTLYNNRNNNSTGSGSASVYYFESVARNAYRFLDMLGYRPDALSNRQIQDAAHGSVFPYPILTYNCIYQNYYRLDNRESFRPDTFNVDQYFQTGIINPSFMADNCGCRLRPFDNDYFNDIKVSPIVDVLNLNNKYVLETAQQYLTRGVDSTPSSILISGNPGDPNNSPFFGNPASSIQTQFGFNNMVGSSVQVFGNTGDDKGKWRGYDLDENPGILGSDFNVVTNHRNTSNTSNLSDTDGNGSYWDILHTHSFSATGHSVGNGLDIGTANIRAMFASEKLWSVTGRAKKKYDDQTLAHFGFKVPHDPKHEISCFGSDVTDISIGEVISTSNTSTADSGSPLGEIAGKGYAAQGNQRHKFTAPCHGVVMAIFSIVPEEYYTNTFLKANKLSSREDLYTPEYDHLGMQPLFGYEVSTSQLDVDQILGWQYRYEQWKRRYNRCTTIFSTHQLATHLQGSLSSWIHTIAPYNGFTPSDRANSNSYYNFLHFPNELNDLFLYQYQTAWSSAYETNPASIYESDPFVISSHIDCVKVSTMSDYSLPRLDA